MTDRERRLIADRDNWVRLFNRLDAAVSHHRKSPRFKDSHDDALYHAQDRITRDAAGLLAPVVRVDRESTDIAGAARFERDNHE